MRPGFDRPTSFQSSCIVLLSIPFIGVDDTSLAVFDADDVSGAGKPPRLQLASKLGHDVEPPRSGRKSERFRECRFQVGATGWSSPVGHRVPRDVS